MANVCMGKRSVVEVSAIRHLQTELEIMTRLSEAYPDDLAQRRVVAVIIDRVRGLLPKSGYR